MISNTDKVISEFNECTNPYEKVRAMAETIEILREEILQIKEEYNYMLKAMKQLANRDL